MNTIKSAHQLLEEIQAEKALLKVTINKRNRHILALKSTNETMQAVIADMRAKTTAIFESESND